MELFRYRGVTGLLLVVFQGKFYFKKQPSLLLNGEDI